MNDTNDDYGDNDDVVNGNVNEVDNNDDSGDDNDDDRYHEYVGSSLAGN